MYRALSVIKTTNSRPSAVRALHLTARGAVDVLRKEVPNLASSELSSNDGVTLKIYASRQANAPVIEGVSPSASQPISWQLDVTSDTLGGEAGLWAERLGHSSPTDRQVFLDVVEGIWRAWLKNDLLQVTTTLKSGKPSTISNISIVFDDFALTRQPFVKSLRDDADTHPLEKKAEEGKLFYHKVKTGGNIGCYGYGAGVAMSTMDALVAVGGRPANFLDGGGGATEANVLAAMGVILSDSDVKVALINSFGGLTKTDMIAKGVVDVLRKRKAEGKGLPKFVIRLRGTGEKEAKKILEDASDLKNDLEYIPDLKLAAQRAVSLSGVSPREAISSRKTPAQASQPQSPVVFSRDGQYERTLSSLHVDKGDSVMVLGVGKSSQFHNKVGQEYGTNIVGSCAPNKGGQTFLDRPVFGSVKEGVSHLKPSIASVFVPPVAAADSIIDCIEQEIPLVVAYAEGIPTKDQLRVQHALRSQEKTRLIGANCPGVIFPHQRIKLGIQPLAVHHPGFVGLASRSGTISYELAAQTTELGLGQSVVFGLGGDPFPGTRTWEALRFMLDDPFTKVICLVGEIGGQMEEEAAVTYTDYLKALPPGATPKPVVGFVAGQSTQRGLTYGHAGAIWWNEKETARNKIQLWQAVGIKVAPTLGDIGGLVQQEVERLGITQSSAEV